MPDPTYTVAIEFVLGSFTNVTSDCFRLSLSRQLATYERGLSMGRCNLIMDNYIGKYSPANSAGAYHPNLKPNKRLQIQATWSSSTYDLFTGYIDTYVINPELGKRTTYIQASDRIKEINMREIDLPIRVDTNPGSLFTDILSITGVVSADRVIDSFNETIPFAWFQRRKGAGPINDLITFGNYQAFVDASGKVNIKNRYFNIGGSVVASLNEFFSFGYRLDERGIGNVLRVSGTPRKASTSVNTVA